MSNLHELVGVLRHNGIANPLILQAFGTVDRQRFVPKDVSEYAYDNAPLAIGFQQTISQPLMIAIMMELAGITRNANVLEIGTGSGYQTAILAQLGGRVTSIERIPELALRARTCLEEYGSRIELLIGDGGKGYPPNAPYDAIIVSAACPELPSPLGEQLKDRTGKLIIPIENEGTQEATLYVISRTGSTYHYENHGPCRFVPLQGEYGRHNAQDE